VRYEQTPLTPPVPLSPLQQTLEQTPCLRLFPFWIGTKTESNDGVTVETGVPALLQRTHDMDCILFQEFNKEIR
jgi:hypothetical protein